MRKLAGGWFEETSKYFDDFLDYMAETAAVNLQLDMTTATKEEGSEGGIVVQVEVTNQLGDHEGSSTDDLGSSSPLGGLGCYS